MKASVLLAAPWDGKSHVYVKRGLEAVGWKVEEFPYRRLAIEVGPHRMNEGLRAAAVGKDLVLVLKGESIAPATYSRLRQAGVKAAIWHFDPRPGERDAKWLIDAAREAEYFFTIGKGLLPWYRAQGINAHWLLEAADPESHHPGAWRDRYDVGFIGTIDGVEGREAWIRRMRAEFGDQLHLWGSYGAHGENHHGRAEPDEAFCSTVTSTSVNLGRDRCPDVERSYGARLFRTLAAGGCLLTNDTAGIREDFNGCVAVYSTDNECVSETRRLLENPEVRRKIAARGHGEVLKRHMFRHRAVELARAVGL